MRREQYESFFRPFRCVLANGFLLLVSASPTRIENKLKITKLEFNNLVFEFAASMAFDTKYLVSRRRLRVLQTIWLLSPRKF